jgi:glycosyltransferase involved in cell wall biosynthesis
MYMFRGRGSQRMTDFAVISNVPTPYRLHVLRRLSRELPGARLHSIFTHRSEAATGAWKLDLESEIRPFTPPAAETDLRTFRSSRSAAQFAQIRDHLTQHQVKLIILLGYADAVRLKLIRWAKDQRIPLLLAGDSNVFSEGRLSPLKAAIKRIFLRRVLRQVAGLMPMGTAGRAFFRLYLDHDLPTFLFPYEPDYAALQRRDPAAEQAFRERHQLATERHRLLYCGRLVDVKRVDVLVDAYVRIAEQRPEWDLVVAGDGPLTQALQQRVPENFRGRVKWLGFLQYDDTVTCMHVCDALVLPSDYEPWALVINEAVASGLAVVTTEVVGAAVELVRHRVNGLIIPPRNIDAMAEALLEVTQLDRCRGMQAAAPALLEQWRTAADPVDGVRQALRHFGLV